MFAVTSVLFTTFGRGRPSGQHGRGRSTGGSVPPAGQYVLKFGRQPDGGRQRLDVVMRETPALLAFVAREVAAAVGGQVVGGRGTGGQRVICGSRELVIGSPKLVEFQSEFRAVGIVGPRGGRGLVRDRTIASADATAVVTGGSRRHAILRRRVYRHFSVSKLSIVT